MIRIEKIIPGGQGLGTGPDGKKIFFWNALPGELISDYQITKKKSHYDDAIATKIEEPSPARVPIKDSCYLSTSPWQIMTFDYEQKLKQELVVELFREQKIDIKTPPIYTDGKEYFYRNKMEYSLYWDNDTNKIIPAFHARNSRVKVPIETSSIERPEIFSAATRVIKDLNARGEEARKYQSLLLRCNMKGEVSGGLLEKFQPHPIFENLKDELLGYNYSYSPNGFFQINLPVYEIALREIKKYIDTEKVLDLYAGVGTIGLSVARDKVLTLVESDFAAFNELRKNISVNKHNVAIYAKSEEALDFIEPDSTVIMDPPRGGCEPELLMRLLEVRPPKILYLSCNPATQARDVKILLEKYHITDDKIFNFFPHTPHIENLVVLS